MDASYDSGVVTINFDLCGEQPLAGDWVGIYPCESNTIVATPEWWASILANPGYIGLPNVPMEYYGFEEGMEYVSDQQLWWSYTCSSPIEGNEEQCQQDDNTVWPSKGTVVIDPAMAPMWAFWGEAWVNNRVLEPGCYKVLLSRDLTDALSPPPLPTICPNLTFEDTFEFQVP